jgi:peptidyl-prolyl cis-trans isomerase D
MAGSIGNQKLGYRVLLGAVVVLLGGSMLLYLVPQTPGTGEVSTDTVAKVGNESITIADIRKQLDEIQRRNSIPKQLEGIYAQQILQQQIFEKEIEYEAKNLGITVTDQERADRIRQFLPTVISGGSFVGMDRYSAEVQSRFQLTVPVFEELIRQGLVEEKFRKLVTDGISAGPTELQDEFRYKNEKIKLDYALIKPEELEAKITPEESEISAAYSKNRAKYQVPEKRSVRYALVDLNQIRQSLQVSDEQLKIQYMQNIQQYQVPSRVHAQRIVLMTVSKTDAEVDEIKKKAEEILKQVKSGGKFDELAKKYSEDAGSKDKGGDLGWIIQGQTVPEFERTAFGLNPGQISDLVRTQYGFDIIKVLEKEQARTKTFDEVKDSLRPNLLLTQTDKQAGDIADKLTAEIRKSNKLSLDDLARQYHLVVGETRPVTAADPLIELGNSREVKDAIFSIRPGELKPPVKTDRGYVVLAIKDIQPAHQGTLDEVRDRIISDLKRDKSTELAKSKADELVKRARGGEEFDATAKGIGLEAKTSESIARNGSIPGAASGRQLSEAFRMKTGDVGPPLSLGQNWMVYRISEKIDANPAEFEKQKTELATQALQTKRELAFKAFRVSLEERLKKEGKLTLMPEKMKTFGSFGGGPLESPIE